MEFRRKAVQFESLSGSGPRVQSFTEVFPRNVRQGTAGLAGYSIGFGDRNDRDFGELQIEVNSNINSTAVEVDVTFGLRDWSGEWDDEYFGLIEVLVLAELDAAEVSPIREDLQVTGMEITQATQFFRSENHLDSENVRPDNSIPLVADKTTGVRVYVDYDVASGLPPITDLSGELEVITPTETVLITPTATISPQRDSAIDRGQHSHTLNFIVAESYCRGAIQFRCRVFDASDATQVSAFVSQNVRFYDMAPVNLFVVGVNYTGQGLNLPAPTLADFLPDLWFTEQTFPIPGVVVTGYTTIDNFSEDMNASTPCAKGFTELNKLIRDLKGDSKDIYYGVLPDGDEDEDQIDFGSYSGCASNSVASGPIAAPIITAHEIGHRLGRSHVPCDFPSRCDAPGNPDENYPSYGNYPSDSIGEFGYDTVDNQVLSPAERFDFMGYSRKNRWISPYTYSGLMQQTDSTAGGSAATTQQRGSWNPTKTNILFLDLVIDRQRRVTRRTSFHYPAFDYNYKGKATAFSVEFLDECRNVLACFTLHEEIQCGCHHCWPRNFTPELPMPPNARWLLVWEDEELLYEECLPHPPSVAIDCNFDQRRQLFEINWTATHIDESIAEKRDDFWYLTQWQDVDGTWRGWMPRTQERRTFISTRLFGKRRTMKVRVLASSGVATGVNECLLHLPTPVPATVSIVLTSDSGRVDNPDNPVPLTNGIVRVHAFDDAGRSVSNPGFVWFNEAGQQIGRGHRFDLKQVQAN
ncbi:MAG: hypothetical protein HC881_00645 [Leptolyngbyaceae cyanobacterium SL_7_1]|nr:hypothetical protein [Leptolyngbyaceae cyanobacterium SL_7_1]